MNYVESTVSKVSSALDSVSRMLGWADGERGPLGHVVTPGAKVVIKPNWVMHENGGPWGWLHLLLISRWCRPQPTRCSRRGAEVVVGDAPLQSCDFGLLFEEYQTGPMVRTA